MNRNTLMAGLALSMWATGCAGPQGKSTQDKRSYVDQMRQDMLDSVAARNPELEVRAKAGPGYGVFSNIGGAWGFGGGGQGYGVVVNNKTSEKTYMRVVRGSLGLGIGLKEYKVLVIFNDPQTFHAFVTSGWDFGGEAAASATTGAKKGGEVMSSGSMTSGLDTYQFTDRGFYVRAAVEAAKCYPDKKLNEG